MSEQIQTPSWGDVPPSAKYMAMDGDGTWWWYNKKPTEDQDGQIWKTNGSHGEYGRVVSHHKEWSSTLTRRPRKKPNV